MKPKPYNRARRLANVRQAEQALSQILAVLAALSPTPTPAQVAAADQRDARHRDEFAWLLAQVKRSQPDVYQAEAAPTLRAALLLAMARRIVRECPHNGGQILVLLGLGVSLCQACTLRLPKGWHIDDGHCDICDLPVPDNHFFPFLVMSGDYLVCGDAGACCAAVVGKGATP